MSMEDGQDLEHTNKLMTETVSSWCLLSCNNKNNNNDDDDDDDDDYYYYYYYSILIH
jgi:hypothetical protein